MDHMLRDSNKANKYVYMNEDSPQSYDMLQTAQKIAEKTQRALQIPLNHLVTHPRDEKLIQDDSPNSSQVHNGVLNECYQPNHFDVVARSGQGDAEANHGNKRRKTKQPVVADVRTKSRPVIPNHDPTPSARVHNSRSATDPLSGGVSQSYPSAGKVKRHPTGASQQPSQHRVHSHNPSTANAQQYDPMPLDSSSKFSTYPLKGPELPGYSGDYIRYRSTDSLINVDTRKLPKKGDYLSFHNIVYKVKTKKYMWSKPTSKTILNNISGIMMPGVNVIMGPTGSGKSSILDVLAGRKDPVCIDGKVLINGAEQPKNFKCMSGYVVQDDIVMGTLTVKENLMFSAALRLPLRISREQKEMMVLNVIEELGLQAVTHCKIGTELLRGVSGGERKRCNIGMELITDPKILFLDEPTTGLDAYTAATVIKTLQKLSRKGKTIVLSIHQPKYSIYKLFDRYTLMAKGNIVYHGKAGSAPITYFSNLGYSIEPHNNPADFYIDIINGEVKNEKEYLDQHIAHARRHMDGLESSGEYSDLRNLGRSKSDVKARKQIVDKMVNSWSESPNQKELRNQLQAYDVILEDDTDLEPRIKKSSVDSINYATPWFNQLNWVCWRTALNLLRNPQTSTIQLGVYLFFALSMGVVYFKLKIDEYPTGPSDRYGLFFFSALQVIFVNIGAIEIFIKERPIFIHENSSGYYRVSSYFIAKLLCDLVPIKVFPAIVFLPITYFMAGLKLKADAFFYFELILLLTTSAGCSIAFFTSATFSVFGLANVVTSIIYVFMMVFSGYFISVDSIFNWLSWCRYLSAFRYALVGLTVNELEELKANFCTEGNKTVCYSSEYFLDQKKISHGTRWDLWQNPLGLFVITIVFLALCYIQLRRINKYK